MQHLCKVIAIANQKGGVGKTTTTAALGAGLAREGYNTLLIDLDAQANLTMSLGWHSPDDISVTIASLMGMVINDEPLEPDRCILTHDSGVKLIPSNIQLSALDATLVNTMSRESVLRSCIHELRPLYDYILIDCTPSLGMLTINALAAADSVLIPVQAHFLSAKGIELLLSTINKVRRQINPSLKVEGILLTMLDNRSSFTRDMVNAMRTSYVGSVSCFRAMIPSTVRTVEASAQGVTIFDHDPGNKAAQAYQALTEEVLANHGKQTRKNRHKQADQAAR